MRALIRGLHEAGAAAGEDVATHTGEFRREFFHAFIRRCAGLETRGTEDRDFDRVEAEDDGIRGDSEPGRRAAVLDLRVNHGSQRLVLQVLELRHDIGVCMTVVSR